MKLEGPQTEIRATKMVYEAATDDKKEKSFISSTSQEERAKLVECGAIIESTGEDKILTVNISNISKETRADLGYYV